MTATGPRSLSGHPLEGEVLMRLIYSDEAGISQHEPWAVVASVIVHGDQKLTAIERHFERLIERHIPEENREGFVFHATEIFGAGKTMKKGDPFWDKKRAEIAADLADIPRRFNLPIALGFVERASFPQSFEWSEDAKAKDKLLAVHISAFMTSAMMVEHWMRQNASNEICLMIVEDNEQARRLIKETQRFHQRKDGAWAIDPNLHQHFPLRKIKEDPLFQPKRGNSPLQIADFCAFVHKRILNQDHYYDKYEDAIWPYVVRFDDPPWKKKAKKGKAA